MQKHDIEIVLIRGEVRCVYINGYRVAGPKPYVSEDCRTKMFPISDEDMAMALSRAKEEIADDPRGN